MRRKNGECYVDAIEEHIEVTRSESRDVPCREGCQVPGSFRYRCGIVSDVLSRKLVYEERRSINGISLR